MDDHDQSRRAFVKKAAYVAPAILTLAAIPAYSRTGSEKLPPNAVPPWVRPLPPGKLPPGPKPPVVRPPGLGKPGGRG